MMLVIENWVVGNFVARTHDWNQPPPTPPKPPKHVKHVKIESQADGVRTPSAAGGRFYLCCVEDLPSNGLLCPCRNPPGHAVTRLLEPPTALNTTAPTPRQAGRRNGPEQRWGRGTRAGNRN